MPITEKIGAERLDRTSCNPALTGITLPKLLWVRESEPEVGRFDRYFCPRTTFDWCLTGDKATDVADASGTLLFDVASRNGRRKCSRRPDLMSVLPRSVHESPAVTGSIQMLELRPPV